MNFSGYFVLAAAVFLVVFAQKSDDGVVDVYESGFDELNIGNVREFDTIRIIEKSSKENEEANVFVNATIALRDAFIRGTEDVRRSQDIIKDGIKTIEDLVLENPEAANKLFLQALENSENALLKAGIPLLKSMGIALSLSNNGARQGLRAACELIQEAGFSTLDALNLGQNLFTQGLAAGGNANQVLLTGVGLSFESGFAGSYSKLQKSIQVAHQALRDAQRRPMKEQIEDPNCEDAANDPEVSDAIYDINEAANNAMNDGASLELIREFKEYLTCSLGDLMTITAEGQRTVENIKIIAEIDRISAKISLRQQIEVMKKRMHEIVATIFLYFGDIAFKSGNQSNNATDAAISALDKGKIEIFLGTEAAEVLIVNALLYSSDALEVAVGAAAKSLIFGKTALLQEIVEAARLVLSVL